MTFDAARDLQRLLKIENEPEWRDFLRHLDDALETQIRMTPGLWQWFDFYDTPDKPLSPREFLEWWTALSESEKFEFTLFTPADILKGK